MTCPALRQCNICKEHKPQTDFYKVKRAKKDILRCTMPPMMLKAGGIMHPVIFRKNMIFPATLLGFTLWLTKLAPTLLLPLSLRSVKKKTSGDSGNAFVLFKTPPKETAALAALDRLYKENGNGMKRLADS